MNENEQNDHQEPALPTPQDEDQIQSKDLIFFHSELELLSPTLATIVPSLVYNSATQTNDFVRVMVTCVTVHIYDFRYIVYSLLIYSF